MFGRSKNASSKYSNMCTLPAQSDPTQQVQQPTQQGQQIVHLNWSHFKTEFPGKPEEDAGAHLLQTNNWMNAHHFLECIKVQIFCLTLVGEARLQYESLTPINIDWQGIQNLFRQQYSKIGNTKEQLFHACLPFTLMKIQRQ